MPNLASQKFLKLDANNVNVFTNVQIMIIFLLSLAKYKNDITGIWKMCTFTGWPQ